MIRVATVAALLLGGCAMTNEGSAVCDATGAEAFVGRGYDAAVEAALRQRTGAATVRAVRPGEMVTMDFRADRLTVRIDADGRITGLSCG